MGKKWKLTAIVMSLSLFLCACAGKTNDGEEIVTTVNKTDEKANKNQAKLDVLQPSAYGNVDGLNLEPGTYISILGQSATGEYWEAVEKGAKRAVQDINDMLDYEGEDKVKVVYSGPATSGNVDEQVNILDEELARYPAALGIAIIDSQSCEVQFDLATENNIPIVTFDSASDYQGIMAKVGTNNLQASAAAAARMAEEMKEKGDVIIIAHDSKSVSSRERVQGFREEMNANHPGIKITGSYNLNDLEELKKTIVEEMVAGTYVPESQEEDAAEVTLPIPGSQEEEVSADSITDEDVMDYIFAKNPNVSGIYATSGSAVVKTVEICEERELGDITIVGFDANSAEKKALEEGKIAGLIVQNPYGMGYATVVAAARSVLEMGNEAVVDSGYTWIREADLEKDAVKNLLY